MGDRRKQIDDLARDWQGRRIDRRALVRRGAALGLSVPALSMMLRGAAAQDATPGASPAASPVAPGVVTKSITREELAAQIQAKYPMEKPGATGGQVILGDVTDISTVNAILSADIPTAYIVGLMNETLTSTNPVDGQPAPGLADSWEIAEDGITYTFHLNPNITWHDGQPLTADDVVFSTDMQLNGDTGSQYTSGVKSVVKSYRAVDEHTFEVVSNGIQAFFLFDFYVPIMPKHIWENVAPKDWLTDPGSTGQDPSRVIGSGPFKFKEWVQGDHVTLVKNPDYWDTVTAVPPAYDEFILRVLPDQETQNQALKTGEIDIIEQISDPSVEDMKTADSVNVTTFDTYDFRYYYYNLDPAKTKVFQDKAVRQAMFQALDRQAAIDKIFSSQGEVAVGTQSILSVAYAPDQIENKFPFDLDAANKLLDDAGWAKGSDGIRAKDGVSLKFGMTYTEQVATYEQLVPYMQQQWKKIGMEMTPKAVPFPTLLDAINKSHDYDLCLLAFSWDASGNQEAMFSCDSYSGGFNSGKYCNPDYDALNEQVKHELDEEKRVQGLIDLSKIAWNDLPIGIYMFKRSSSGVQTRIHNFYGQDYSWPFSLPFLWVEQS